MAKSEISAINVDPGVVALGVSEDEAPVQAAKAAPSKTTPACQAAVQSYRTAHLFQVLFTSLVFAVGLASTAALVIAIARVISDEQVDVTSAVVGLSGILGSAATGFLIKQMKDSIAAGRKALADVQTYCGITTND